MKDEEKIVDDLYWEHAQHDRPVPTKCSTCYGNVKTSADEKNQAQVSGLSALRARLQATKEKVASEKELIHERVKNARNVFRDVPVVSIPSGTEYQTDRYVQLCMAVDMTYHNYLVSVETGVELVERLQALVNMVEDFVIESTKVRW